MCVSSDAFKGGYPGPCEVPVSPSCSPMAELGVRSEHSVVQQPCRSPGNGRCAFAFLVSALLGHGSVLLTRTY